MKQIRLYGVLIIVLLSLTSVLVMAQDATEEPAVATLPEAMETALVPCGEGVTGPCDMIAISLSDIAGTAGMLHFEGDTLIMEADPSAPAPFNNPAVFQVRVLKYGDQPVALHFFTISDTNFIRQLDLTQVMIWVGPNS